MLKALRKPVDRHVASEDGSPAHAFSRSSGFQKFLGTAEATEVQPIPVPGKAVASARLQLLNSAPRSLPKPSWLTRLRGRATSGLLASDPVGAAHRVNFDTPPLGGCCRAPRALRVYLSQSAPVINLDPLWSAGLDSAVCRQTRADEHERSNHFSRGRQTKIPQPNSQHQGHG